MSPQLQQRQEASSAQRSSLGCLGVCPSPGPVMLIPTPAGRITLLAGLELAPLHAQGAPTGLCCGHSVPWEGGSLAQAPKDVQDVLTPSKNLLPSIWASPCSYI